MRKNRTRYVLLGLLAEGPKSGYEIKQEIDLAIGHFWSESYGQIYPQLQRLADEGLAERLTQARGGRERFVYKITDVGRDALAAWLEVPPEPETLRHELLLKIYFGHNSSPEVLQRHLRAFRERAEGFVAMLKSAEALIADMPGDVAEKPYWLLTIKAGEAAARTRLAWSKHAIETLAGVARGKNGKSGRGDKE